MFKKGKAERNRKRKQKEKGKEKQKKVRPMWGSNPRPWDYFIMYKSPMLYGLS